MKNHPDSIAANLAHPRWRISHQVFAAKEQLTEIEKRCGKGCEEYAELAKQIDAFVKG